MNAEVEEVLVIKKSIWGEDGRSLGDRSKVSAGGGDALGMKGTQHESATHETGP